MGSKIYVFDKSKTKDDSVTTNVLSIDCRSHTVQHLPSIAVHVYTTLSTLGDVINGKIYVLGYQYRNTHSKKVMVVLNTETQTWEPMMTMPETMVYYTWPSSCVMMDGKMYLRCSNKTFVYDPKENRWETDEKLDLWMNPCVVADVMYCYDSDGNVLIMYDPKQRRWGKVRGLEEFLAETKSCSTFSWTGIVGYGGKLALFFPK
ncbi:unnamed protein product [Brassica oleracea var. botrytis]|uniref:FKB95-like N-terminal Kelch domain-containing protein n=1 Tax=Brassica carinata TaxID=52824 RepID=A0A8X7RZC0_BRACI|nr:hypothetical protein Bca52824_043456 [Brassica carinata]